MTARSTSSIVAIPPLAVCERVLDWKAKDWEAKCFAVATAFVEKKIVDGDAVYGHWRGPVAKRSRFYEKSLSLPFIQHGWVVLPDDRIVDPTRWCFEAAKPYVFYGDNQGEYDEGGNRWRALQRGPVPCYEAFEDEGHLVAITKDVMDAATWSFVERYLELDYTFAEQPVGELTEAQIVWLAHAPPDQLGDHAGAVYAALKKLGRAGIIPIDNRRMIERLARRSAR